MKDLFDPVLDVFYLFGPGTAPVAFPYDVFDDLVSADFCSVDIIRAGIQRQVIHLFIGKAGMNLDIQNACERQKELDEFCAELGVKEIKAIY